MQFLNPALLAGALLFAIPLLIHLLNRQRHKRRPWAAMEFLLRAWQKQRNRLRTENLLLLLLRCLLPIALALAIARPVWRQAAALLAGPQVVHHVVVVDGSYSMGLRQDGTSSPFDRARALVARLLEGLEQQRQRADKVTLVLAGVRPRFVVRGDLDLAAARNQWAAVQRPEDGSGDLVDALLQVARAVEESAEPETRIYVLSDLQARSFGTALAAPPLTPPTAPAPDNDLVDSLRDIVERLQARAGTELHWIDIGPFAAGRQGGVVDNVQITDLRLDQPAAVLRAPAAIVATVRNRGLATANCELTLEIDGGEPLRKVLAVPPGAEAEADFQVVFREAGRRRLKASLLPDALAADDERFASIDVRERIRVLLVDGEAGGDPLLAHRFVWQLLDPDPASLPTFAVETIDLLALLAGQCTPADHDIVVLADVERLNDRAARALVAALQAGRGLVVAYGERADVHSFNLHLHAAGEGPQPFRLTGRRGTPLGSGSHRTSAITAPDHPVLREFDEERWRAVLQNVPIGCWHGLAADTLADDAAVVLTLNDADQSPLLIARPFADGKAVFLMSPLASKYRPERWNLLHEPMVAFPLLWGIAQWLALPATDPFQAEVGAELACSLPARPENAELQRPERDGRPKLPLAEEPQALPGGRYRLGPIADTAFAGFYVVDLLLDRPSGREALSLPFAVNVGLEEGDLRYAAHEQVRQTLGLPRVLDGLPGARTTADDPDRSELGPSLLLLTLLLALGEAALARHIAVRRS